MSKQPVHGWFIVLPYDSNVMIQTVEREDHQRINH